MWYWFFKFVLVRPVVTLGWHSRVEGLENVPRHGGAVLASNHVSALDTLVMPALMKRRVTFPAKAELFAGNRGFLSKVIAWFLKAIGQVPLDRSGGRASMAGMEPVLEVLQEGHLVGIYPEGTRSPDGRLYKGKTGVARMALAARVPVIPIAMVGSEVSRKVLGIPWADHPVVRVGKPLDFSRYDGAEDDRAVIRWVTDEVMAAIQELGDLTYVDAYGTSVKYGSMSAEEADRRIKERPGDGKPAPEPPAQS
ncbi:lysophospholipid acyltransferase family protein [Nigerium massiliense]|uniref:lysophospholipid acyltransferase family protein n=1 Tax=Nigerium massiliense TaxID=1522317 RepID=UPI00058DACA6|nr:lysophospholipid acyltransferase family protein [Nigerium massiliense]